MTFKTGDVVHLHQPNHLMVVADKISDRTFIVGWFDETGQRYGIVDVNFLKKGDIQEPEDDK